MSDRLVIRGAREHNLQDVSLDLPRDQLVVFTGLSGSGKSSLAFDTIYAEGQRRYVESLSAYARQFLGQMDKPDVDFIEGLSPAISIDQKSASRNPRSTVGTITEVYDYLRLLYARIGRPHCPNCGRPVARQTPQQIVDRVMELPEGTRFQVLAPVVRGRKGEYSGLLDDMAKQGFSRVRVDGETVELADRKDVNLARYEQHTIEVVVDRLVRRDGIRQRLTESIETALGLTGGTAEVAVTAAEGAEEDEAITFSQHLACTHCGLSFEEPAPRNFSFNSPYGACETCAGLGTRFEVDPELVVPDPSLSLDDGALAPWAGARSEYFTGLVAGVAELGGFSVTTPWKKLRAKDREARPLRLGDQAGPRAVPQPLRAQPLLPLPLRGDRALAEPAPRRGRVGLVARADRAVHARGGLPGLRRGPPQARVPGRDHRRHEHLRALQPLDHQGGRGHRQPSTSPTATTSSPTGSSRRSASACSSCSTWGSTTSRWPARPGRSRAARRSASGWPARSAADWWACSTCSTSRRSACTSGTTSGSSGRCCGCATSATRSSWSSTTRRPSAPPTTWWTSVRVPASTADASSTPGRWPGARGS